MPWKGPLEVDATGNYIQVDVAEAVEGWNLDCPCALRDPTLDATEHVSQEWAAGGARRTGIRGEQSPAEISKLNA